MNCEPIESWISAYQDDELDGRRRRILQAHLASCPACRALSQEWEALAREIRAGLAHADAPDGLHARVMRQIFERKPASARRAHPGSWRLPGWLSWGLVPLGAATAWLLLAPHMPRPAPATKGDRQSTVVAAAPLSSEAPSTAANQPAASSSSAPPLAKSGAAAQPKLPRRPLVTPEPLPSIPPGKAQGTGHPETEWRRRIRRIGPRRGRYPVAESPRGVRRPRRRRARLILAARPPQAPAATATPLPSSITVVDYVLPEVQPPLSPPEAATDFVLHPAEPAPTSSAGFSL